MKERDGLRLQEKGERVGYEFIVFEREKRNKT